MQVLHESQIVARFLRFLYQLAHGLVWFYENVIRPVTRPFIRAAKWVYFRYRELWDWFVYTKSGHFSRTRAGALVTLTVAFIYALPKAALLTYDAGLFLVTSKYEDTYLTFSQEIYPDYDIHSVKGCEELPCTDQNAIYYRVRPHYFHHLWSLYKHGSIFYPDFVAAAVPPGISKCHVLSYGFRIKILIRQFDIYQDLLEISCVQLQAPQR
jgi:hypothetical protein